MFIDISSAINVYLSGWVASADSLPLGERVISFLLSQTAPLMTSCVFLHHE